MTKIIHATILGPTIGTKNLLLAVTIQHEVINRGYHNLCGGGFTRNRKVWTLRLAEDAPALGKKRGEHTEHSNTGKSRDWKTKKALLAYLSFRGGSLTSASTQSMGGGA